MARAVFAYGGTLPFFGWTGLQSPITELAVSLAAFKGNHVVASGTAVIVAPHLAMAAKHVIQDFWRKFEGEELNTGGRYSGTYYLIAHQQIAKEGRYVLWDVTKIWYSELTDIAFLLLAIPHAGARYEWNGVEIDLSPVPPKIPFEPEFEQLRESLSS
jgi:hypothetical protein